MVKIDNKTLRNLMVQREQSSTKTNLFPVLAIDYGEKFCGCAFSPDGICVFPIGVFPRASFEEKLRALVEVKKAKILVFGLPLASDGTENFLCTQIRVFAKEFEAIAPVQFLNERHSTQSLVMSAKYEKQNMRKDDLAAGKILEYFLQKKD